MAFEFERQWEYGDLIGRGSFGDVLEASDGSGRRYAAKFVNKADSADRELLLADIGNVRNVVPVVDRGETDEAYVLIMPRAEESLRDLLQRTPRLSLEDALPVLIDIATALADLGRVVVHRDLKPENLLLLDGHWSISDFGISRYAEAATATLTHRGTFTWEYAAPEQWNAIRASAATDIYAFGVIAFELVEGRRPFSGSREDLCDDHLHSAPPAMSTNARLAALIVECLQKQMEVRPGAANVLERLVRIRDGLGSTQWEKLARANSAAVQRRATSDAEEARAEAATKRRSAILDLANESWRSLGNRFMEVLEEHVPAANVSHHGAGHVSVELGQGKLGLLFPSPQPVGWDGTGSSTPFDIVATSALTVMMSAASGWNGRSHALIFGDLLAEDEFAWFETAYTHTPGTLRRMGNGTFLEPDYQEPDRHVSEAFGEAVGLLQIAWTPTRVNVGDVDDLVGRWLDWLADASEGALVQPSQMPEQSVERVWRS